MPPRARANPAVALAGLVTSESEPDLDAFDESEIHAARTMSVTKKPRGRPPGTASKVTKSAPRTRRTSSRAPAVPESAARPTATRGGRNAQQLSQDETVTFDDIEPPAGVMSTATKKVARGRPRGSNASATKKSANDTSLLVPASAVKRRGRPPRQAVPPIEEIPETQHEDTMELDVLVEEDENVEGDAAPATEPPESWAGYDIGDASLRRRLGDLTKKYESLEMRHRDLREVGVKEAERNFERLKKQAEERTAAANQLIAELKAELAAQAALAKDGEQLRKQLEASEAKAENLEGTIEDLNDSLSTAKTEIKTIYSKLAAVRSREDSSESIIEGNGVPNRTAQAAAQAKEDLYADLTGLIIRSVKQEETEDIFDCIQTGCNGTLHFKLTVANGENSDRYEDMVFSYQPRFVDGHDRDLQDMLPNFLVLDIDFERSNVPKFYKRLFDSMTKDSKTKQINEAGSNAE